MSQVSRTNTKELESAREGTEGLLKDPCFLEGNRRSKGHRHLRVYGSHGGRRIPYCEAVASCSPEHADHRVLYCEAVASCSPGLRSYPGKPFTNPMSATPTGLRHPISVNPARCSEMIGPRRAFLVVAEPLRGTSGSCWLPIPRVAAQPWAVGRYRFAVVMPSTPPFLMGPSRTSIVLTRFFAHRVGTRILQQAHRLRTKRLPRRFPLTLARLLPLVDAIRRTGNAGDFVIRSPFIGHFNVTSSRRRLFSGGNRSGADSHSGLSY